MILAMKNINLLQKNGMLQTVKQEKVNIKQFHKIKETESIKSNL